MSVTTLSSVTVNWRIRFDVNVIIIKFSHVRHIWLMGPFMVVHTVVLSGISICGIQTL